MIKKLRQKKQEDKTLELAIELAEMIKEERNKHLGQFTKSNSNLYEVNVKFNSKYISKSQYNQLLGLSRFMRQHKELTEGEIRKILAKKPIVFAYLIKCDRNIADFLDEVKEHGAYYMAEYIAGRNRGLEDWANKRL